MLEVAKELAQTFLELPVARFLKESLMIEGIHRDATTVEITATLRFLGLPSLTVGDVSELQKVYAPKMPLRRRRSMNVRVGGYVAPQGGPEIVARLRDICEQANGGDNPWYTHVEFEKLHPYMDGNGRSGRAMWAWHMRRCGRDPFALGFLHRFYYDTLANVDRSNGFDDDLRAAAAMLDLTEQEIRLAASEMTAQEMRTVKAVLAWRKAVILRKAESKPEVQ